MKRMVFLTCFTIVTQVGPVLAEDAIESALSSVAQRLATQMSAAEVRKLAVVEFSDLAGYESALGLFVAEELTTQLFEANPGGFDIVERQQLQKVLKEQKLSASSLFDAETIEELGRILGIEALVTGSIADLGESIKINARSISVETAKVFAAASARCAKDGVVEQLLAQSASPHLQSDAPVQRRTTGKRRQIQAADVFFQNKFMRMTVQSMSLSEDRKYATLAVVLENLTASDILLAIELANNRCQARLIDNLGNELLPSSSYAQGATGIICLKNYGREPEPAESFTRLAGKSKTTAVLRFKVVGEWGSREVPQAGSVFSLGINFIQMERGGVHRFSAGISNIEAF